VKATRAYIAGLGTSGVLIASFLLLLIVGSAIVAFRGAPGQASNDGLDGLDVTHPGQATQDAGSPLRPTRTAETPSARRDRDRRSRARRARRDRDPDRGAGRVRSARSVAEASGDLAGGAPGDGSVAAGEAMAGGGAGGGGAAGGGGGLPRLPVQVPRPGGAPSVPSVGGVAEGVGGTAEQTTGGLGETVGEAAPPLEEPVAGAGETVGGGVEQTAPAVEETVDDATGAVEGATGQIDGATGGLPGTPTLP
jgi:hypothetical protein